MSETTIDTAELGEKIVKVLKTIFDPEIPVDIYELGLIYDVFVNEDYDVKILMTLEFFPILFCTSLACQIARGLERLPILINLLLKLSFCIFNVYYTLEYTINVIINT